MKTFFAIAITFLIACGSGKEAAKPTPATAAKTDKPVKKEPGAPSLTKGIEQYKTRDYENSRVSLRHALNLDLSSEEQASAHKHLAFIASIQKNTTEATKSFLNAFFADDDFKLEAAETGNPVWTPSYEKAAKQFALHTAGGGDLFNTGKQAYTKRNFDETLTYLELAVKKKDLDNDKKAEAYKYLAFTYAQQKRPGDAKDAFKAAFDLNKNFELDKSEYGNPVWTPLFDEVKKSIKK